MSTVVEMRNITKRFPTVTACDRVDFELRRGEIHALLGENGAGKTTLMKILFGMLKPDSGKIYLQGKKVEFRSPHEAIEHKVNMVHQSFMLVPVFTVLENIVLGIKSAKEPLLDIERVQSEVTKIQEKYGLKVDLNAKVADLSMGEKQRTELLRALYQRTDVLILDEPTTVLTPLEVKGLFEFLKRFKEDGGSVVFISHKLPEVMQIGDQVTVLRHGKKVAMSPVCDIDIKKLALINSYIWRREPISSMFGAGIYGSSITPEDLNPEVVPEDVCAKFNKLEEAVRDGTLQELTGVQYGIPRYETVPPKPRSEMGLGEDYPWNARLPFEDFVSTLRGAFEKLGFV